MFVIEFTQGDYSYVEGDPNARACLQGTGEIAQPATATVYSHSPAMSYNSPEIARRERDCVDILTDTHPSSYDYETQLVWTMWR